LSATSLSMAGVEGAMRKRSVVAARESQNRRGSFSERFAPHQVSSKKKKDK
jgi:hypothetical protein